MFRKVSESIILRENGHFVFAGEVADPEEGGGGMGPCLSPGAPDRAYPLGHQPGTLFGLERAISKGSILTLLGANRLLML